MQGNMGYGPNGFIGNSNGTGNPNNMWSNGWNGTGMNPQPQQTQTPVQQSQRQPDTKIIVNGRSGRRYYDSEKEKAIHKLHHMMDNTDDPERKNALKIALNELELK